MTKLLSNPTARLAGRALVAGVAAALVLFQTSSDWTTVWKSALVAGVLAFCEVFTPLNSLVGVFKQEKT